MIIESAHSVSIACTSCSDLGSGMYWGGGGPEVERRITERAKLRESMNLKTFLLHLFKCPAYMPV